MTTTTSEFWNLPVGMTSFHLAYAQLHVLRISWVEFFDASDPGPFGDYWHTKEGVSQGNAGGPWDGASGPMNGCMRGLKAKSSLDMLWYVCPPASKVHQVAVGPRVAVVHIHRDTD